MCAGSSSIESSCNRNERSQGGGRGIVFIPPAPHLRRRALGPRTGQEKNTRSRPGFPHRLGRARALACACWPPSRVSTGDRGRSDDDRSSSRRSIDCGVTARALIWSPPPFSPSPQAVPRDCECRFARDPAFVVPLSRPRAENPCESQWAPSVSRFVAWPNFSRNSEGSGEPRARLNEVARPPRFATYW